MRNIVSILTFALLLVGCKKTPDYVINKGDMADLMVDIYKAESILENNKNSYNDDSLKMTLRQSVMMKHGVTQAQLDTSLIWYSHNIDVYKEVYNDIIDQLEDERKELSRMDFTSVATTVSEEIKPSMPRYDNIGDTADLWSKSRTWALLPSFTENIVTLDISPDEEYKKGDKYDWAFKLNNYRKTFKAYLAVDYNDGASEFVINTINKEGWCHLNLQSDSLREITRIYGYIIGKSEPGHIVYLDSVELIRTHLDRNSYMSSKKAQKLYELNQKEETDNKHRADFEADTLDSKK